MKLADASLLLRTLAADWRYIRFATLTRPFLGAQMLPVSVASGSAGLSDDFLRRVQECYKRSCEINPLGPKTIWSGLEQKNKDFLEALQSENLGSLKSIIECLFEGSTIEGMAHVQAFVRGKKTIYPKGYFSHRVKDTILSLSEALGVSCPPSNQQTSLRSYVEYLNQDMAPLIEKVEAALGHSISMPMMGCPPVAEIGGRYYNPDLIRHAYIPYRIRQLGIGTDEPVLEIGGGYGCVARYAALHGYQNWTIIDLPYVNAIQMIWIGATLGEQSVSGLGEVRAQVHLVPSNAKELVRSERFALALNMDSLPEIPAEEADDYLDIVTAKADMFLSVNQEAQKMHRGKFTQNSVHMMMQEKSMIIAHRVPYWMEQGYVEELYHSSSFDA